MHRDLHVPGQLQVFKQRKTSIKAAHPLSIKGWNKLTAKTFRPGLSLPLKTISNKYNV